MEADTPFEPATPLEVEREMVELTRRLDAAPKALKEYHNKMVEARAAYRRAYALAYKNAEGTQADRKAQAELETVEEWEALDRATVEYRYLSDTYDSLRTKLRALQSISSLMKAQMMGPQGGL